jgi:hypothetical protein
MVLQQQAVTEIIGETDPDCELTVELFRMPRDTKILPAGDSRSGVVFATRLKSDARGRFRFDLPAMAASFDSYELLLSDQTRSLRLTDLLVGDVYLFLGSLTPGIRPGTSFLPPAPATLETLPPNPWLRFFDSLAPATAAEWTGEKPFCQEPPGTSASLLSALAGQFGRELAAAVHLPVGLLLADAPDWRLRDILPDRRKQVIPCLKPLEGLPLRGVVWSGHPRDFEQPEDLKRRLIELAERLRAQHPGPDGSLLAFVMLLRPTSAAGQTLFYQQTLGNEALSYVRHHLAAPTALVPVSGLKLTADLEQARQHLPELASRLCTISRGLLYGQKAPASAPECASIEMVGGKLILTFSDIGEGLRLRGEDTRVRGFTICGPDRIFREAEARLLYGVRVMVWHEELPKPAAVTYAFYDTADEANLISRNQLPIIPFRSDQIESVYCLPREWRHCDDPAEWQIFSGPAELRRDPHNKTEGEASLLITGQAGGAAIGPRIDRPCDFPPLDLKPAQKILVDVFNPDSQTKQLTLSLMTICAPGSREQETPPQTILPALRWQTLTFDLGPLAANLDLTKVIRLKWQIRDPAPRCQLYLDNIRLRYS